MLQISGGKLSLDNLQLEMDVPEATMLQDVSLLRVGAGEADQLELDHCVLTVRNPELEQTREAAFIDIVSGSADRDVSIVPVNLQDCILRGRATVVRMRQSVGLDLVWNNGLLITSKRLLLADGSSRPTGDGGDGTIRVRLDNVTADVGAGLCLLRDSVDRPHQPPLELECAFCVIVANGASLIEHEGVGDTRKYRLATMTDRNFYDGIDVFWRVTVDNIEQQSWDWTTWQKNVSKEGMPSFEETIKWSRDRSEVEATPMHLRGTGDYLLDPKIKAAVIKAGSNAEALPPLKRGSEDTEAASASPDTADSL